MQSAVCMLNPAQQWRPIPEKQHLTAGIFGSQSAGKKGFTTKIRASCLKPRKAICCVSSGRWRGFNEATATKWRPWLPRPATSPALCHGVEVNYGRPQTSTSSVKIVSSSRRERPAFTVLEAASGGAYFIVISTRCACVAVWTVQPGFSCPCTRVSLPIHRD